VIPNVPVVKPRDTVLRAAALLRERDVGAPPAEWTKIGIGRRAVLPFLVEDACHPSGAAMCTLNLRGSAALPMRKEADMPDHHVITRLRGRNIVYRDGMGLLHQCKGFASGGRARLYWTLCQADAPAQAVRPQRRGETIACPQCWAIAAEDGRRILAAAAIKPRVPVGGLPFRPQDG
jgi:hypothetical protein